MPKTNHHFMIKIVLSSQSKQSTLVRCAPVANASQGSIMTFTAFSSGTGHC